MATTKNQRKQILFAHSAGAQYGEGKGSYDLVRYLKENLSTTHKVHHPTILKPSAPTYNKYKKMFDSAFREIDEPVILVGHSLGSSTLLKYLDEEKPGARVSGLFLVATPRWDSSMKEFQLEDNFQAALKNIPAIFLYHSLRDPEVPFDHSAFYAKALDNATLRTIKGKEHLFSKGLPELLQDIRAL